MGDKWNHNSQNTETIFIYICLVGVSCVPWSWCRAFINAISTGWLLEQGNGLVLITCIWQCQTPFNFPAEKVRCDNSPTTYLIADLEVILIYFLMKTQRV